jgi:hypothetical protein
MPEPNRPPFRIEARIEGWRLSQIAEAKLSLVVMCDACPNFRVWKPMELRRDFGRDRDLAVETIAMRLRCRHCRSAWIRVGASEAP